MEGVGNGVPALVQSTKMGFLFLLDRVTGEPLYPIEERPVPTSNAEGETKLYLNEAGRFPFTSTVILFPSK